MADNGDSDFWIIIVGNPVDGFIFYGPFGSHEQAISVGEYIDADWWIAQLRDQAILLPENDSVEAEIVRRLTNGDRYGR